MADDYETTPIPNGFSTLYHLERLQNVYSKIDKIRPSQLVLLLFLLSLAVATFFSWNQSIATGTLFVNTDGAPKNYSKRKIEIQLSCSNGTLTKTCPTNIYPKSFEPEKTSSAKCPEYFRWIHEDLRLWKNTGITRDMVERAKVHAHFRLVIVDGKAYFERLNDDVFQTRDIFTLWGILQLLRLYPGMVPDLELVFMCHDRPVIPKRDHQGQGVNATSPPALFHYCADDNTSDIIFPDWTFWGWAETNIKPWANILEDIKEGNKRSKWKDRVPLAYWKGNPYVAPTRVDMLKCNASQKYDWNARIYSQNWNEESVKGYKHSRLEEQCSHRYKIYVEGWAWSVSSKYIMACDAMTLLVKPHFYDFFIRGMVPMEHYWPIRTRNKCKDIKFAVEWGNNHTEKAQAIGEAGSKFIQENLKMEYVYAYMFHVLSEYAKLLKFKPAITPRTVEVCPENVACPAHGLWRKFLVESLVKSPSDTLPCTLPPPYDPQELKSFLDKKESIMRTVESWGDTFWHNINKTKQ